VFEAAVAGAIAGYAIAIPVGAIAVLIIHIGLTGGLRAGVAAAAGAASADAIYATLAVLAGYGISVLVGPLMLPLRVVGGVVLIGIGLRGLLTVWRSADRAALATGARPHAVHGRTYVQLLGLTLLNPATVIYFAALAVGLPFLGGLAERLAFAAAAFIASLSWQVLLAGFGVALGRGAGHRLRRPTMLLGNLMVVGFGVVVLAGAMTPAAA
jgi:threonine/homoserine/homoserine lactone efflux protein